MLDVDPQPVDLPAGGGQVTLMYLSFLQSFNFSLTSYILSEEGSNVKQTDASSLFYKSAYPPSH